MAVSGTLGSETTTRVRGGEIAYRETGSGPALVFAHGALINADTWRMVVPALADGYRCICPDLPLGSHTRPMDGSADLSPPAIGQLILDFLDALELDDVTVISHDTATAFTQIAMAKQPERIARVVLIAGDTFKDFFPPLFKFLVPLGYVPGGLFLSAHLARGPGRALGYRPLSKRLSDPTILESYLGPGRSTREIRRDASKVLRSVRPRYTLAAAEALHMYTGKALLVWGEDDFVFPVRNAKRLLGIIPEAKLEMVPDSRSFIQEDNPSGLVQVVRPWLDATNRKREPASASTT